MLEESRAGAQQVPSELVAGFWEAGFLFSFPSPLFPALSFLCCFHSIRALSSAPSLPRGSAQGVLQSRAEVFKQEAEIDLSQAWGLFQSSNLLLKAFLWVRGREDTCGGGTVDRPELLHMAMDSVPVGAISPRIERSQQTPAQGFVLSLCLFFPLKACSNKTGDAERRK